MDVSSKSGIYRIVNSITLKVYVGSAVNLSRRLREHLKMLRAGTHHSQRLQRSFDKWGEGAFEFEVIELAERDRLLEREQAAIDLHRAADHSFGYNICVTAGSNLGRKFGIETRERIRKARVGTTATEATRLAMSAASAGKPKTVAHAAAISRGKTGCKRPDVSEWAPERLSRFKVEEVRAMRAARADGETFAAIAKRFDCNISTAHQVVKGKGAFYGRVG